MPNRLSKETSPYLLQHAQNPVDWYAWGDEALSRARDENRPILLSIGYSACHWCHVMERESFEDQAIAELMNELFISIKVDREERPDLDEIYMTATRRRRHRGSVYCLVQRSDRHGPVRGYESVDHRPGLLVGGSQHDSASTAVELRWPQ